ncbi:MAG: response regulator [Tuberibacillus sp.]
MHVLIVEDDPMVAKINSSYLSFLEGFQCAGIVSNSQDALKFLEAQSIDLLLLDIYMPGKNGLELLSVVRKKNEPVDVIIITAASDIESIKKALRYGVVDYLIKPFTFERFQEALLKYKKEFDLLHQHRQLNQDDLDQLLLPRKISEEDEQNIPKGLTKETLQRTIKQILKRKHEPFSTESIAMDAGISRISMRKYLNYLTDIGCLHLDLDYKSIGRPTQLYTLKNIDKIKSYLKATD